MSNIENIVLELEENVKRTIIYEVPSFHWVRITHIINPHSFYVRQTCYGKFIRQLESIQPSTKPVQVVENAVVAFNKNWNSDATGQYVRGTVARLHQNGGDTKCDIFVTDHGFLVESVPIEELWECHKGYSKLPPLAIHCRLAECVPRDSEDWNDNSIGAFINYVGDERARMKVVGKTNDQLTVVLYNSCPDDIAALMALTGYSTMGYIAPTFY